LEKKVRSTFAFFKNSPWFGSLRNSSAEGSYFSLHFSHNFLTNLCAITTVSVEAIKKRLYPHFFICRW
jgi:hypothetical protein